MPTIEEIIGKALDSGKPFSLSYVLADDWRNEPSDLTVYIEGKRFAFKVESLGYTPLAEKVKRLLQERFGELVYEGGDFRQESYSNGKVRVHFDPGWGSFQIHITPK
jgi:hypothetical protein